MSGYNNRARSWLAFAVVIIALACANLLVTWNIYRPIRR